MKAVLPPDLNFVRLRADLGRFGWEEVRVPGLRPPLVPGEPELARFEQGGEVLHYSFNPAVRLRVVDGPLPEDLLRLDAEDVARLIGSDDAVAALCGVLAAAELELTELQSPAIDAADRMAPELSRFARPALRRLGLVVGDVAPREDGATRVSEYSRPAPPTPPIAGARTEDVARPVASPARSAPASTPDWGAAHGTVGSGRASAARSAQEHDLAARRSAPGALAGNEDQAPASDDAAGHLMAAYDALPIHMRRQILRRAIRAGDPLAPALVARSWGGDPELAATAAIGAARMALAAEAGALEGRAPPAGPLPRRERELLIAVRRAALATLRGERPGPEDSARNRLWRAVLGEEAGDDAIAMAVAALIDPAPDPAPEVTLSGTSVAMRRVEPVPHWLGHDLGGGLPNPVRRWTPPAPFLISTKPLTASNLAALGLGSVAKVAFEAIASILAALSERTGRALALPLADEWEAALRGTDGRPQPWGLDARPPPGAAASPWGVPLGRPGEGEWTRDETGPVVCGADPSALTAYRITPADGARLRLRVVTPAE